MRGDYFDRPTPDRIGIPKISYPVPCPLDTIIVLDGNIQDGAFRPLMPGTPIGDGDTAHILVWEGPVQGSNGQRYWRRIYSNGRRAQDAYNAVYDFVGDSITHPVFIRRYLELRETYAARTKAAALTSLINLRVTAGGTGYSDVPLAVTVTFTGGAGSGAAAIAEVQGGIIVALRLTSGGTGYTSAPAVGFTGGGGSGATGAAAIQPVTALLVEEKAQPADGEEGSMFLIVSRTYMTLPGPVLTRQTTDEETQSPILIKSQFIVTPTFPIGQVDGSRNEFVPTNTVYGTKIVTEINNFVPPSERTEFKMAEFSFPALLAGITGTPIEDRETVLIQYYRRPAITRLTQFATVFQYGTRADLLTVYDDLVSSGFPTIFDPLPTDVVYDGIAFNLNSRNVLNDEISLTFTSTDLVETVTFGESTPSYSDYIAYIGEFAIIGVALKPWRYGWWRIEIINVLLK